MNRESGVVEFGDVEFRIVSGSLRLWFYQGLVRVYDAPAKLLCRLMCVAALCCELVRLQVLMAPGCSLIDVTMWLPTIRALPWCSKGTLRTFSSGAHDPGT